MPDPKFLQIHTLTSYPATLLNRDDAGFAKRLPFGGATRTRVSSQCLKYHWRNFDGENALYGMDVPRSLRSRETFYRRIVKPLIDDGYPEGLVRAAAFALQERLLSDDKAGKRDLKTLIHPDEDDDPREILETNQVTIFGVPEMRYLRNLVAEKIDDVEDAYPAFFNGEEPDSDAVSDAAEDMRDFNRRDLKKNLKGLELASGLDAAMFGRMATSDVLARGDAAVHVAHAFTTHEQEAESDYFSAVDELRRDDPQESGEMGAGHINSQELTSGLFYGYVTIDVPLLVSNLSGVERENWTDGNTELREPSWAPRHRTPTRTASSSSPAPRSRGRWPTPFSRRSMSATFWPTATTRWRGTSTTWTACTASRPIAGLRPWVRRSA